MKKIELHGIFILAAFLLSSSCSETQPTNNFKYIESNSAFENPDTYVKKDFLQEYASEINNDTTILIRETSLLIRTVIDSAFHYRLPEKYSWDSSTSAIPIYGIKIIISKDNFDTTEIESNQIATLIDDTDNGIKKYGVILSELKNIKATTDTTILLPISFSIPFTDLGIQANINFNIKSMQVSGIQID